MLDFGSAMGWVETIEGVLSDGVPRTEPDLLAACRAAGAGPGPNQEAVVSELLDSGQLPLVHALLDGRLVFLPALLAGRVFTHRVQADEIDYDLLGIDLDLEALLTLVAVAPYDRLVDGTRLIDSYSKLGREEVAARELPAPELSEGGAILLPAYWWRQLGVAAGDLVAMRVTEDGLRLDRVAETAPGADQPGRGLRETVSRFGEEGEPVSGAALIWTACAEYPELFRDPGAPVQELLGPAGLTHKSDLVALAGFNFEAWLTATAVADIQRRQDVDEATAAAVLALTRAIVPFIAMVEMAACVGNEDEDLPDDDPADAWGLGPDADRWDAVPEDILARVQAVIPPKMIEQTAHRLTGHDEPGTAPAGTRHPAARMLSQLADPEVAMAFLEEMLDVDRSAIAALVVFGESVEKLAPRGARPALHWLRARALERLGETKLAESALRDGQSLDPDWPPLLYDLARFVNDRGDADAGLLLLRRAGVTDGPLFELLAHYQSPPAPQFRRNEPCWCGSGRKYKQCHLRNAQLPMAERAAWLYQKAVAYIAFSSWREDALEIVQVWAEHAGNAGQVPTSVDNPLIFDLVLFEGGAFADFLAVRGELLPADERSLAEQWLLIERSVFEAVAINPGTSATLRDLRTGDVVEIAEKSASRQMTVGMLVCGRIAPTGDTYQIFGGLQVVQLFQRDGLLELLDGGPDPAELAAYLAAANAPPQLANTEGDPLLFCEAELRTPDPAALQAALDQTYDRDEPEDPAAPTADQADQELAWTEHVTTHGMERVRASLRLRGEDLHVAANSEARFERVLAAVRSLQPSLTLTSQSRRSPEELRSDGDQQVGPPMDQDDPQIVAMMETFIRQYEQSWLDDSIPALAGYTPRQAAADPTRREDLIRLIDSLPARADHPGAMDPDRLRVELGLT